MRGIAPLDDLEAAFDAVRNDVCDRAVLVGEEFIGAHGDRFYAQGGPRRMQAQYDAKPTRLLQSHLLRQGYESLIRAQRIPLLFDLQEGEPDISVCIRLL